MLTCSRVILGSKFEKNQFPKCRYSYLENPKQTFLFFCIFLNKKTKDT